MNNLEEKKGEDSKQSEVNKAILNYVMNILMNQKKHIQMKPSEKNTLSLFLSKLDYFKNLNIPKQTFQEMSEVLKIKSYKESTNLYKIGKHFLNKLDDKPFYFFILLQGRVSLRRLQKNKEKEVQVIHPGQAFGDFSIYFKCNR